MSTKPPPYSTRLPFPPRRLQPTILLLIFFIAVALLYNHTSAPTTPNPPQPQNALRRQDEWKVQDLGNGFYRATPDTEGEITVGESNRRGDVRWHGMNGGILVGFRKKEAELVEEGGVAEGG